METITHSEQETKAFGKKLATQFQGGDIVCLYGELGAGKTTLVKGIAEGFGIKEEITSPTFTLMNVYPIKTLKHKNIKAIIHTDTYRLKDEKELLEIGVEDYLGQPETVTIIEWPEKVEGLLKGKKIIRITLEHQDSNQRKIKIL